jgi:uncharacterized repeat protein (TIGR01451 family)
MNRTDRPWPAVAACTLLAAGALLPACECQKNACCPLPEGYACAELAFPTGDRSTSTILVRQASPKEARAGQECNYIIDVTNLTGSTLQNVSVKLEHMDNVHVVSSWPGALKGDNGDVSWIIPELAGNATKTITVRAKPLNAGVASNCLTAAYANMLCATTSVVAPSLTLTKSAPADVCGGCGDIQLTYTVRNPGSGKADDVTVTDTLPAGLSTPDGGRVVAFRAGDLEAGAQKTFTANVRADKDGTFVSSAAAQTASGIQVRSTDVSTVVRHPAFAFSCDANNRVFLGRDLSYRLTVRNTGSCDAADATVMAAIPAGSAFVSADHAGHVEGGHVVWNMSSLPAGKAQTVTMNIRPSGTGTARITASASAKCVPTVTSECETEVGGIPAILMEVVDTVDPIQVGEQTTFNVTVTNQGSSGDTNVRIVGTLPPSMEYVSAAGATEVTASGQVLTMAPLATLAPGAKAEWRVTVRAKSAADARSRWELSSDQFKAPIVENESTTLYE